MPLCGVEDIALRGLGPLHVVDPLGLHRAKQLVLYIYIYIYTHTYIYMYKPAYLT